MIFHWQVTKDSPDQQHQQAYSVAQSLPSYDATRVFGFSFGGEMHADDRSQASGKRTW